MKCNKCGIELLPGQIVCSNCGEAVPSQAAPIIAPSTMIEPIVVEQKPVEVLVQEQPTAAPVVEPIQNIVQNPVINNATNIEQPKKDNSKFIKLGILVAIIIVVILLVVFLIKIFNNNTNASTTIAKMKSYDESNPIVIKKNNKMMLYTISGKKISEFISDNVVRNTTSLSSPFEGGYGLTRTGKFNDYIYTIVDIKGKNTYSPGKDYILEKVGLDAFVLYKNNSYNKDGLPSLIDHNGKVIVKEGVYTDFEGSYLIDTLVTSKYIVVTAGGKKGLITEKGQVALKPIYKKIYTSIDGAKYIATVKADNNYYAFVNGSTQYSVKTSGNFMIFNLATEDNSIEYEVMKVYNDKKNKASYLLKDGKLIKISDNYYIYSINNKRYITVDKKDSKGMTTTAIYDIEKNKIVDSVKSYDYYGVEKNSVGTIPIIIKASKESSQQMNVLTPYCSTTVKARKIYIDDDNNYFITLSIPGTTPVDQISQYYYTVYDSNCKKISTLKDWTKKNYIGADPTFFTKVLTKNNGKNIFFTTGNLGSFRDTKNNIIMEKDGWGTWDLIGDTIYSVKRTYSNSEKYNSANLYSLKGKLLLKNVDYINYTNTNSQLKKNNTAEIKVAGKVGIYNFSTYKYLIKPQFDSIRTEVTPSGNYYYICTKGQDIKYYNKDGKAFE